MSNEIITRLVVGEPMIMSLGRPVAQRLSAGSKTAALRWSEGAWVSRSGSTLAQVVTQRTFRIPLKRLAASASLPRRHLVAAGCAITVIAVGAMVGVWWRGSGLNTANLPIAPAAAVQANVKVVGAPYMSEPRPDVVAPLPSVALPIASPDVAEAAASHPRSLPAAAPVPATVAAARLSASANLQRPAAKNAEAIARPPAVLLDEPVSTIQQRPAANQLAAPSSAKPAAAASGANGNAKVEPSKLAPPARGTGLVAITPDGKFALFSNPKTRLPEQFKVGDQLPNGETVKTVDFKEGRVVTSSREYSLE